jgi:hypothetical protein
MVVKGYLYSKKLDGDNIKKMLKEYFGYPKQPDYVTTEAVRVIEATDINDKDIIYIPYDEMLLPILGEPIEIELKDEVIK